MVNCKDYGKYIYLIKMILKYDSVAGNLARKWVKHALDGNGHSSIYSTVDRPFITTTLENVNIIR